MLYELFTGRRYSGQGEMPEVAAGSLLLFGSLPFMDAGFAVDVVAVKD